MSHLTNVRKNEKKRRLTIKDVIFFSPLKISGTDKQINPGIWRDESKQNLNSVQTYHVTETESDHTDREDLLSGRILSHLVCTVHFHEENILVSYYESRKRELKIRLMRVGVMRDLSSQYSRCRHTGVYFN